MMDTEILQFYSLGLEEDRLTSTSFNLERERTLELLARHLPPSPAAVLDVGGGAGVYALPLSQKGYRVELIDPVPLHIERAQRAASSLSLSPPAAFSARQGDARSLPVEAGSVDVVLLFGPLYHLVEEAERIRALREAWRVLKPCGVLLAVGISRFASALDGMSRALIRDPRFVEIMHRDLQEGQHRNPTGDPRYFTTAYLHRPEDLVREVGLGGFTDIRLVAIEGPMWTVPDLSRHYPDEADRRALLDALAKIESEPTLMGSSAHLMAIGRKP